MIRAILDKMRLRIAQRLTRRAAPTRAVGTDDELVRFRQRLDEQMAVLETLEAEARLAPHSHYRKGDV